MNQVQPPSPAGLSSTRPAKNKKSWSLIFPILIIVAAGAYGLGPFISGFKTATRAEIAVGLLLIGIAMLIATFVNRLLMRRMKASPVDGFKSSIWFNLFAAGISAFGGLIIFKIPTDGWAGLALLLILPVICIGMAIGGFLFFSLLQSKIRNKKKIRYWLFWYGIVLFSVSFVIRFLQ